MSRPFQWQVQAHIGPAGMQVLQADWRRIAQACQAGPHLSYEIHLAYFACHSLAEGRYTCLALSDGERVRAICPLEHQTFPMLGRHFAAIGLPSYMMDLQRDLLCEDDEARAVLMPLLLRWLQSQTGMPRWLVMDWVPADSQALRAVQALPVWRAAHSAREPTAVFDCRSEAPAWEQRFSQKFRWSLRHGARRLQAQGEPRYTRYVHPDALQPAFETFLVLEASGWKSRADIGLTVRDRPQHQAFYQFLVSSAASGSGLEIHLLHLGEVCIAGVLCLRSGRELAIPKISYDERYAGCSPGQLMLQWTLALCRADPTIDRVNMVSNAAWLRSWRPDMLPNYRVLIGLRPLSGPLWTFGLRVLLAAWPKLKGWLRVPKRTAS